MSEIGPKCPECRKEQMVKIECDYCEPTAKHYCEECKSLNGMWFCHRCGEYGKTKYIESKQPKGAR